MGVLFGEWSRCCHSMKGEIVWEIDAADIFIEQSELDPKWVKAVSFASMVTVTAYLGIEFMRDLVSKPQSIGEAGLRHPTGCTNELSQTKNTKMSESDLSNSELKKKRSSTSGSNSATTVKKKSSSKLKKSKENIPDINVLVEPTSKTNQQKTSRSAAKIKKSVENITATMDRIKSTEQEMKSLLKKSSTKLVKTSGTKLKTEKSDL